MLTAAGGENCKPGIKVFGYAARQASARDQPIPLEFRQRLEQCVPFGVRHRRTLWYEAVFETTRAFMNRHADSREPRNRNGSARDAFPVQELAKKLTGRSTCQQYR